ncbi:hypothetical protein GA0061071_105178 [Kosakonia oryzendophytica]|uniref:Acid shock protein n=1 Tax=Kosakonia oryzendophytica TaxID=1005665 RepID=A0A1C4BMT1_9ENTR|nr:hypothetical protein [Kosakonia oryzendophytica]SCC08054.1 hypothetical protein GA0061071_105178 [Kosakonia oryzendophytica]
MKKIARVSAILAVSVSSMVFAADHEPLPPENAPGQQHHKAEKKPLPPKHKPAKPPKRDEKKPPMPEDQR